MTVFLCELGSSSGHLVGIEFCKEDIYFQTSAEGGGLAGWEGLEVTRSALYGSLDSGLGLL